MKIAVITGASSGMGREFVHAVDKAYDVDEIWVIARREKRLMELSKECKTKVRPLELDLMKKECTNYYKELLGSEKPEIKVLVNAAGIGLFGTFAEMDMDQQLDMIDLNVKSLTAMCYISIPYMSKGSEL